MRKKKQIKQTSEFDFRPKLRLAEVERIIKRQRILVPAPSRTSLITMCEHGVFETAGGGASQFGWLVYEDSFLKWAKALDEREG
jgi:hypothetical protein